MLERNQHFLFGFERCMVQNEHFFNPNKKLRSKWVKKMNAFLVLFLVSFFKVFGGLFGFLLGFKRDL